MTVELASVRPAASAPDEASLERWLEEHAIGDDGAVWSWLNPTKPGYAYPEAAGLHLAGLGRNDAVAAWLVDQIDEDGAVGRNGYGYAFDTAVALNGLLTHRQRGGVVHPATLEALFGSLARSIERRAPSTAPSTPPRWSTGYHPHLLKTAIAIHRYDASVGETRAAKLLLQLVDDFASDLDSIGAALGSSASGPPVYVHAACYAVEGALYLDAVGVGSHATSCHDVGTALARLQREDGALPAWSSGEGARTDATAQAVRIWSALSPHDSFAQPRRRALRWLASMQHPSGGMIYEAGSDDVNSWASIFALQALRWSRDGAELEELA